LQTCKPANLQTCKPANLQTCKPANLQTCKPANLQTCKPANLQTATCYHFQSLLLMVGRVGLSSRILKKQRGCELDRELVRNGSRQSLPFLSRSAFSGQSLPFSSQSLPLSSQSLPFCCCSCIRSIRRIRVQFSVFELSAETTNASPPTQ
jgi:hypothetical protein